MDGAQEACKLNGTTYMGRPIKVQLSWQKNENTRKVETTNTVFVGNLNFYTTEASLFEFFNGVGDIKTVRLARDSNGNVKGFAHVEFYFPHQAFEALKLNESLLGGRPVRVELAGSKKNESQSHQRSSARYYNNTAHYSSYQYGH
jgi:nucleolin